MTKHSGKCQPSIKKKKLKKSIKVGSPVLVLLARNFPLMIPMNCYFLEQCLIQEAAMVSVWSGNY